MTAPPESDNMIVLRRTLVVAGGVGLAVLVWQLQQLLLVAFASGLLGLMLHDFAELIARRTRLPWAAALALAVLVPLAALTVIFALFGTLMYAQFAALAQQLPAALVRLQGWLNTSAPGREVVAQLSGFAPKMEQVFGLAQATLSNVGSAVTGVAVVLVAAVYIAAQPQLYVNGLVALLPKPRQAPALALLVAVRDALTAWLKGQAIGMAFVAVGTTIGLMIVGLPSALAIGLVAGLCEFVPYLGVVIVTVPTVILGFGQGVQMGWGVIIVLVVVQQLQGNLVMPMAQRRFGDLPPVLTIFSLIAAGTLLGPMGVILAVPLTVVGVALVKARMG